MVVGIVLSTWSGAAKAYTVKTTNAGATVRWNVDTVGLRLDPSVLAAAGAAAATDAPAPDA